MGGLCNLHGHAEGLGNGFQGNGLVAHLDALDGIFIGMGTFIGCDPDPHVTHLNLQLFGEGFLDDGDLVKGPDLPGMVQQPQQGLLLFVPAVGIEIVGQFPVLLTRGFPCDRWPCGWPKAVPCPSEASPPGCRADRS